MMIAISGHLGQSFGGFKVEKRPEPGHPSSIQAMPLSVDSSLLRKNNQTLK
jgi:hypothetical protein